jgi:hypothetical protein
MNSRAGSVQVDGQTLTVLQIRPEAIEPAYLTAVGASDVDQVLHNPTFHPLGDHDGDKQPNVVEWMFNTLETSQTSPFQVGGLQGRLRVGFQHRTSPWATATLQVGDDLNSWSTLTFENGTWTAPAGTTSIPLSTTPGANGSTHYELDLDLPDSPRPGIFLRGLLTFP